MKLRRSDYEVVLADPPWPYNQRRNPKTKFGRGAIGHYPLMTMDEIRGMPVSAYCADSAVLFLWATFPRLKEAIEVVEAWGFEYKTVGFVWVKTNGGFDPRPSEQSVFPPEFVKPFFGVGYYTKSNVEVCLLGTRGKIIKPAVNTISQLIVAPRRKHSEKPPDAHYRIDAMYPNSTKCELFARKEVEGWDCYGNMINTEHNLSDLKDIGRV